MQKLLHNPITISALLLFALFSLSAQQAHAQEINSQESDAQESEAQETDAQESDANKTNKRKKKKEYATHHEISTSSGQIFYDEPELWDNRYYSVAWRHVTQYEDGTIDYIGFEAAETLNHTSDIDGLTRRSSYQKVSFGWVFNKSNAPTTSFFELGFGLLKSRHYVKGVAAWNPNSETRYYQQTVYENRGIIYLGDTGLLAHFELGVKIQNRHRLSLYIQPMFEGDFTARNTTNYQEEGSHYYGSLPQEIANGMAGFRYSYLFGFKSFD